MHKKEKNEKDMVESRDLEIRAIRRGFDRG
jgi:hypothetical protein